MIYKYIGCFGNVKLFSCMQFCSAVWNPPSEIATKYNILCHLLHMIK